MDYLLSTLCRRTAAVSSLLAGVPAVADRIAVEPPIEYTTKTAAWACDKSWDVTKMAADIGDNGSRRSFDMAAV